MGPAVLQDHQSQQLSNDLRAGRIGQHRRRLVGRLCLVDSEFPRRHRRLVGHGGIGYSTNGGATWTKFPAEIPGAGSSFMGGTIAASTTQNFIWAPAGGQKPYYTLNGGSTWTPITLPASRAGAVLTRPTTLTSAR